MTKLNFVSLTSDGTHLVLQDEDGATYHVPITPELRSALRKPAAIKPTERPEAKPHLRPRDIQAMLRAGATISEVAARGDISDDYVRRYEGPIIAERRWAIQQARECAVGHELGAPTLGDLVIDRLAERGVDTEDLAWHAFRDQDGPWSVTVQFEAGGKLREARWKLDLRTKSVRAVEDEARWLSETDSSSPRGKRHARTFEESAPPVEQTPAEEEPSPFTQTESLLDQLARHRGRRREVEPEQFDPLTDPMFGSDDDIPSAHPSRPEDANDAVILSFPERSEVDEPHEGELDIPVPKVDGEPPKPKKKSGRRSVPSWDEIVFGGKNDD